MHKTDSYQNNYRIIFPCHFMSDLCAKREKNASKLIDLVVVAVIKTVKCALQVYLL